MEGKFTKLRNELNTLGYIQTLKPDCVPLVDRLLSDLKTTTESLQKYMKIAQQAIEERDYLQLGAEPYKCDNAKLIRECNELHLAFIQFKEQHEKVQKELKTNIVSLENQLQACESERQAYVKQIKDLEVQLSKFGKKGVKLVTSKSQPTMSKVSERKSFQLDTALACADQKIAYLSKEINALKEENLHLTESNKLFKNQLQTRDEEITRLKGLLEGGRPLEAISKDCCYKNIDNKIGALRDEISSLKREKNALHNQVKDALAKQHEAMRRALHLAERNQVLEKEMKDIDQMALAVEAECNSAIRSNVEKVTRLQDRMNESVIIIQNLERENNKLKLDKQELSADLDAVKLEKKHLQSLLDTEIEDKKRLTDRINSFTIIEHDLNMEIDRLVRLTGEQKRHIAELECQVTDEKIKSFSMEPQKPIQMIISQKDYMQSDAPLRPSSTAKKTIVTDKTKISATDKTSKGKQPVKKPEHKNSYKKVTSKKHTKILRDESTSPPLIGGFESQVGKCCCEADSCIKHMKELLDKEMEYRQTQAMQQIESLKQEKEYYMKEYHRVCDQMRNLPTHDKPDRLQQQYDELLKQIKEKDDIIGDLENKMRDSNEERYALKTRVGALSALKPEKEDVCEKPMCKRQRRELEITRDEFKHLEKDYEDLKMKQQLINESSAFDQERMKKAFMEMEQHIKKLETERRELVMSNNTSRTNEMLLQEEADLFKEKLKATQHELNILKANYNQLRTIHEQADEALLDAQNKVRRSESELDTLKAKISETHRESECYEKEIGRLNTDLQHMKKQLSKIDKEKDEVLNTVDEKTEKMAMLEDELREKKGVISSLEMELKELKRKLGNSSDEIASQQQKIRSLNQEIELLKKDYENEKRQKESALQENRRLQNDMASLTNDCRDARKQLEISERQVEDLKRQLQHYVAEVKRTEDLISQKELERTEILDQFKNLSEEANILESSNHTLENEATQSRVQLSVALDHASDLERKLENQDSIIRSYEKQITDLTSQVASLEIQLKQNNSQYDRLNAELKQMKDLCVKLDHERDNLKRELREDQDQRGHVERNIDLYIRENEDLKRLLDKEKNNLEGVEKLLKEARQDVIEQRLLNQDLQGEVTRLKTKLDEVQERLLSEPQDSKNVPIPKKSPHKYSYKDKTPTKNKSYSTETKRKFSKPSPCIKEPQILCSPCYEFCGKKNCPVHKKYREKNSSQQQEMETNQKVYPILKKSNTKNDGTTEQNCVCSCMQCMQKNGYVYKRDQNTSPHNSDSKVCKQKVTILKYAWSQTSFNSEAVESNKEKPRPASSSSQSEVLTSSSRSSARSDKKNRHSSGSFKNRLMVEVPGMECCISSNKIIKAKSCSPFHK